MRKLKTFLRACVTRAGAHHRSNGYLDPELLCDRVLAESVCTQGAVVLENGHSTFLHLIRVQDLHAVGLVISQFRRLDSGTG